jgi:serine phosphatase RsbU (regulator of sigma subunit)/Tfp pilus assembly protein PilF
MLIAMRFKAFYAFLIFLLAPAESFSQSKKIDSLLKIAYGASHDSSKAIAFNSIGKAFLAQGQIDSGFKYARLGLGFSKKCKDTRSLFSASKQLGVAYNYTGPQDSAVYYFSQCERYAVMLRDTAMIAGAYNNLGVVYKAHGNIPKALDYFFKALPYKEKLKDSLGMASVYINLGQLYKETGDTGNTMKYLKKALEIHKTHKDMGNLANTYVGIGLYYSWIKDTIRAESWLRQAYEIAKDDEDAEVKAITIYNLANLYYQSGNIGEAEKLYTEALELSRKLNNTEGISTCLMVLAEITFSRNQHDKALKMFEEAYSIAAEIDRKELMVGAAAKLSDAYAVTGNYKKAYEYHKIWMSIKDSIFNQENTRKLMAAGFKYEQEKEKLLRQQEEHKKEVARKAEAFRRNLFTGAGIIVLLIVSGFSFVLMRRLAENRKQKSTIEQQRNEMIDSINYARRIQFALLAHNDLLQKNLPEHFILFKPKDIVSGDFYWATSAVPDSRFLVPGVSNKEHLEAELQNKETGNQELFYLAVCDCTGHGVPGAFMSLLNTSFLNEAINEKNIYEPGEIFNHVRKRLVENISQDGNKDGMDGTLIKFEKENNGAVKLSYSAANNPPLIISGNEIKYLPCDKMPVGKGEKEDLFRTFDIKANKGDVLYLFTDGFPDQFGGPKGKKFKYKKLEQLLVQISSLPLQQQSSKLEKAFNEWKGDLEQIDDVCIIGIKL